MGVGLLDSQLRAISSPSHHVFAPHLLVVDRSLEAVDGRVALAQVGML